MTVTHSLRVLQRALITRREWKNSSCRPSADWGKYIGSVVLLSPLSSFGCDFVCPGRERAEQQLVTAKASLSFLVLSSWGGAFGDSVFVEGQAGVAGAI